MEIGMARAWGQLEYDGLCYNWGGGGGDKV